MGCTSRLRYTLWSRINTDRYGSLHIVVTHHHGSIRIRFFLAHRPRLATCPLQARTPHYAFGTPAPLRHMGVFALHQLFAPLPQSRTRTRTRTALRQVGAFHFTKYSHGNFNAMGCTGKVFGDPPQPSYLERLCSETVLTLNDASTRTLPLRPASYLWLSTVETADMKPPLKQPVENDETAGFLALSDPSPDSVRGLTVVAGLVLEPAYRLRAGYVHPLAPAFTCVTIPPRASRVYSVRLLRSARRVGRLRHDEPRLPPLETGEGTHLRRFASELRPVGQGGGMHCQPGIHDGLVSSRLRQVRRRPLPAGLILNRIARGAFAPHADVTPPPRRCDGPASAEIAAWARGLAISRGEIPKPMKPPLDGPLRQPFISKSDLSYMAPQIGAPHVAADVAQEAYVARGATADEGGRQRAADLSLTADSTRKTRAAEEEANGPAQVPPPLACAVHAGTGRAHRGYTSAVTRLWLHDGYNGDTNLAVV